MNVQWPVDRYVGLIAGLGFIVAKVYLQICARLPCDEPCPELLKCDHPCPSGEFLNPFVFRNPTEPGAKSAVNLVGFRSVSGV